ncbi:MAG: TonB-dependent receptor [Ignavibacteriales bacterium]|nr:TonB-dependent receptor [Ignavibacteriales bacterium]
MVGGLAPQGLHHQLRFQPLLGLLQDTVTFGRLTLNLGLRYDREQSGVAQNTIPASPWLPAYMPTLEVPKIKSPVAWKVLSPA